MQALQSRDALSSSLSLLPLPNWRLPTRDKNETPGSDSTENFGIVYFRSKLRGMRDTVGKRTASEGLGKRDKTLVRRVKKCRAASNSSISSLDSVGSSTLSDLIVLESKVQDWITTLNERVSTIKLMQESVRPQPIPFEDKPWVKDARQWVVRKRRRGECAEDQPGRC